MIYRIAICAGLAALGVAGATSSQAQVYLEPGGHAVPPPQHEYGGLPPSEILMAVRSSGLRPLTQPARLGPQQYVVLASDNMGGQLRVVVHAHTGRILHAAPAHDPRFAYHPVRPRGFIPTPAPQHGVVTPPPTYSAAPPPDLRTPSAPPPLPPRAARAAPQTPPAAPSQNQGLAGAPDATGSVPTRPARTPLPRPRPAVAANEASAAAAPAAPAQAPARQVETSPEADAPAAAQPAPAAPSAAPAKPAPAETQMVPVAPLD